MGNCCVKDTKGQKKERKYNNDFQGKGQDYYEDIRDEIGQDDYFSYNNEIYQQQLNYDQLTGKKDGQNQDIHPVSSKEHKQKQQSKNVFQNGKGIALGGGGGPSNNAGNSADAMTQSQRRLQIQEAAEKRQQSHANRGVSDPYELEWKQRKQQEIEEYQKKNPRNENEPRLNWN